MKISHESPLTLLDKSREYNDYDYALVHLFEKHPKYYEFFVESLKQGREVILDNSIFELGVAFEHKRFAEWVEKLKPTYYIVPDVLEDTQGTMDSFASWMHSDYRGLPGKKIGVVQGKTYGDLVRCYQFMEEHADVIAISFDYSYYALTGYGATKVARWAHGRTKFIRDLCIDGFIDMQNPSKPIHLLGCGLPIEFAYYKELPFITSLDTSNPVLHGMYGIKYGPLGLRDKHMVKMADVFETDPTAENMEIIEHNVKIFRSIVNGEVSVDSNVLADW